VREGLGLVADDLAEEEVEALDGGGALVERVDLGIAALIEKACGPFENARRRA
jgi:hypothetical protein